MVRIKIVGACLLAACAMGILAASSASAFVREPPEIGRCIKHAGGHWKDGGCKTAAKVSSEQKFEWYPAYGEAENGETKLAEKVKATSVSKEGTLIQLTTVSGEGIGCKKQVASVEATGPKTLKSFNIAFRECAETGQKCTSTNPVAGETGEIKVKELNGLIGIEKFGETHAKDKVANLFKPAVGEIFTEFQCGGIPVTVKGEVLNPLTANSMKLSATVKFLASKGKQKPEKFATDPVGTKRVLEASKIIGGGFTQAGQSLTTIQTGEEKLEINTLI
ncbi:MAG: hypothetical protein ACHQHO_08540 [Solirubrobacterales bacterium]